MESRSHKTDRMPQRKTRRTYLIFEAGSCNVSHLQVEVQIKSRSGRLVSFTNTIRSHLTSLGVMEEGDMCLDFLDLPLERKFKRRQKIVSLSRWILRVKNKNRASRKIDGCEGRLGGN